MNGNLTGSTMSADRKGQHAKSEEVAGSERRDIAFALQYWEELRGERSFPASADVDPDRLRQLWPFVFIVSLADGIDGAAFTYGGEEIARFCGRNPAGGAGEIPSGMGAADCFPAPVWDRMKYLFEAAVNEKRPLGASDSFTMGDGNEVIYRSVVMPLSDGDSEAGDLLGVIKFKPR